MHVCIWQTLILVPCIHLLSTDAADNTIYTADKIRISREARILAVILEDHDPAVIPRLNYSKPITVYHSTEIEQILYVDEQRQVVHLKMWVYQKWADEFLVWDPAYFDNDNRVRAEYSQVWLPETLMATNVELDEAEIQHFSHVTIEKKQLNEPSNHSIVTLYHPAIYKVSCKMNVRYFPWDTQSCDLDFYSTVYPNNAVTYRVISHNQSLAFYTPHSEWHLVNYTYYIINLVIPCVIINAVCILGLFTASSSTGERGEKTTLGLTALLSLTVFLLIVNERIPVTSEVVPLMTWFFIGNFLILSLAIIATLYIMNIAGKAEIGTNLDHFHVLLLRVLSYGKVHRSSSANPVSIIMPDICKVYAEWTTTDLNEPQNKAEEMALKRTMVTLMKRYRIQRQTIEENKKNWLMLADKVETLCLVLFFSALIAVTTTLVLEGHFQW